MPFVIAAPIVRVNRANVRTLLFVTASVIALATAPRALADDECGAPAAGSVTCPVDAVGPDYPNGITYNAAEDLAVNVDDGVSVIGTAGVTLNNSAGNGAVNAPGVTIQSDTNGITADNAGDGSAAVDAAGSITATTYGVLAQTAGAGAATATFGEGTVSVTGPSAIGVGANATGSGDATSSAGGAVTVSGDTSRGVGALATSGAASATSSGSVSAIGDGSVGVGAQSDTGAATASAADVTQSGDNGYGVVALSTDGDASASASGAVSTDGAGSVGVSAQSAAGSATVNAADVTTSGDNSIGVLALSESGAVTANSTGAITTSGVGSHGLVAVSAGPVTVDAGDIATTGEGTAGVIAISTGDATDVTVSGNVQGGWAAPAEPPAEAPATPIEGPLPFAAGVVMASGGEAGTATLTNNGEIGALSDTAIVGYAPSITVNNAGTVTGEVFLFGDEVTFNNTSSDSFDVRNFADTDGDGVRETEGVSISDFGGAGVFNNDAAGAVNLLNVAGATAFDTADALVPEYGDPANHDITLEGVEQGQLTNLAQFNHAGSIVLQDALTGGAGPVAGDVFAIIGGEGGPAEFVSNGGSLWLDTFLDEGGVDGTYSDVLILDAVTLGSGATQVFIANAGGDGEQTIDDGILLVDVLDPAASAAGAFALGEPVIAGAYQYELFQGGDGDAGGDPLDGNWYLRSDLSPTTDLYRSLPNSMLRFGRETIGTLQQRVGNRWWRVPERQVERTVTDPAPPPPAVATCPAMDFVVYFEWDRDNLNPEANDTINAAMQRARQCNVQQVQLIGHTDTSGSAEYNMGLSERRANVVRDALTSGGVSSAILQSEWRGETDLAVQTPDGVREPLNRRTAVTIRVGAGAPAVAGPPPAPRTRTVVDTIPASVEVQGMGVWGRVVGTDGEFESDDDRGVSADESTWLAQAGVDFLISQSESGTLIGSVFGQYGEIDTDVSNFNFGDIGSFESNGYGIGGGVTWYSPNGAYADGQFTYNWLDNEINSDVLGPLSNGEFDGTVWALSLEGGYRHELSPNYYLVPQAQLVYGDADFDDFTDPFGGDVSVDDGDSLVGRLGVAIEYLNLTDTDDGNLTRLQAYGIANVYYEFLGDNGVVVDGISLQDENDELWGELGGGLTYSFNTNWSLYAEGGYRTSLENWGDSHVLRGNLGVRYNW